LLTTRLFSPWRPKFEDTPVNLGFVLDEVALIRDLSSASTSHVNIITPPVLYAHLSAAGTVGPLEAAVQRDSVLSPPQEV